MPPAAPPPEDQPLVVSTMDDLSSVLQGSAAGSRAAAAAGVAAADEGSHGFFGWLLGGWHGPALTAIAATAVTGASIVLMSVTGLTDQALHQIAAVEANFLPEGFITSLQQQYADRSDVQVVAFNGAGVALAPLSAGQALKIAGVSNKVVAEAIQDKGNLSQIQQSTDQKTAFQTSTAAREVLAPPTPKAGPTPPGGGPPPPAPLAAAPTAVGVAVVDAKTGQTQIIGAPTTQQPAAPPASPPTSVPTPPPNSPPPPSSPPPSVVAQPTTSQPPIAPSVVPSVPAALPTVVATAPAPTVPAPTVAPPTVAPPTVAPPTVGPPTTAPTAPVPTTAPPTVAPTSAPPPPAPTATPIPPTPVPPTPTALPVSITTNNPGQAFISLSAMVPADSITRSLAVTNNGGSTVHYFISTSCSSGCGPLWTDTANGLQLTIARGGTTVYSGPISACLNQPAGVALGPGQSDALTYTVTLPASAGNSFASLSTQVAFTWTAS